MISVEVYNLTNKPVQLFVKMTLGILSPIEELTAVKLETAPDKQTKLQATAR